MRTTNVFDEYNEVLDAVKYQPCVSVIMPFEPKMNLKEELHSKLKLALQRTENELRASYPAEKAEPVLNKLHNMVSNLNFNTHKKSIAIFASPVFEKVYYLDIPVEEKIIIDESFEIRDLIYSKKELKKYLVAVLSAKEVKIFLGNNTTFVRIVSNVPSHVSAYENDIAPAVANYTDAASRREVMLDKFMQHTDNGLSMLLHSYPFPVFIIGTEKTAGHFTAITKNKKHIAGIIHGSHEDATEAELRKLMEPAVADWKKLKHKQILEKIEDAMNAHKLAAGINDVWNEAAHKRGRLLVVEKNYMCPAQLSAGTDIIRKTINADNAFYIKDAVDDVIEKVLACGGDVEFVDEGMLHDYGRIALIEYY